MSADEEIERLIRAEGLPADFFATAERFYRRVAEDIAGRRSKAGHTIVAGICGSQGSGKSTMAAFLRLMLRQHGLSVALLSIDDLYLTRSERARLARGIHPLLATRGPPGTHDAQLGLRLLDQLTAASHDSETLLPRFDKANDDRLPTETWERFIGPADVVLFEGWCVGARPQQPSDLIVAINELERNDDPDGAWRHYVNERLATKYQTLFGRIHHLTMLKAPSFDCVFAWRALQEEKLRARTGAGARILAADEIERFVQHYERITRHILNEMPSRADIVIEIDAEHRFTNLVARTEA